MARRLPAEWERKLTPEETIDAWYEMTDKQFLGFWLPMLVELCHHDEITPRVLLALRQRMHGEPKPEKNLQKPYLLREASAPPRTRKRKK